MKKLFIITLAALLLTSCTGKSEDPLGEDLTDSAEQTENAEISDNTASSSEVIYWQKDSDEDSIQKISGNIYSVNGETYIINSSFEPLTKTSEVLNLSGEDVEAGVLKDKSGDLKQLVFNGANREAVWIRDNKAVIVDFYANQLFIFDTATNSVTPVLSDKAYGFGLEEYETLTGKYDKIYWFDVPDVNADGDRIVYWSNKYAENGAMCLTPGIWIADLKDGSEYRLNLGELVPTVKNLKWIDDETIMFADEGGDYYKLNIVSNELEALNFPEDTAVFVSNGYAVYKTDTAVFVDDLSENIITEYKIEEPVNFDKVFERNGIIAFGSLTDGSVWTIDTETKSLDIHEVVFDENQFAFLNGWSENGLIIEIADIASNETVKICGIPIENAVK